MTTSRVQKLAKAGLIKPPKYVPGGVQYEVIMGSEAYGVSSGDSDRDVYGFWVPPKSFVFPPTAGEIHGFGRLKTKSRFDHFEKHDVKDPTAMNGAGCVYDLNIYNIVKYFSLCMENNPNMIDSLFVPQRCVLYIAQVGHMVRDQRHIFLHKGAWKRFKGYAYSQVNKMKVKNPKPDSKRYEDIKKHGYDTKFAYHVVRLLNEVEEILLEHNLTLDQNREQLKAIRRGEWSLQEVLDYFDKKEGELETVYTTSTLQYSPDEEAIKTLLLQCLEEYYGSLEGCVEIPDAERQALRAIDAELDKIRHRL
jgi:predicted nucleotidyltransferase